MNKAPEAKSADAADAKFGPEPSLDEIMAVTRAVRGLLPRRALELIEGCVETSDRSGQAAELGHLLAEAGITDPRALASVIRGSEIHRRKFADRPDGWVDACRIAAHVLAKPRPRLRSVQAGGHTVVLPEDDDAGGG